MKTFKRTLSLLLLISCVNFVYAETINKGVFGTGPASGGGAAKELWDGAACEKYIDHSNGKLKGARCPEYTGCFERNAEWSNIIGMHYPILPEHEDTLEKYMSEISLYSAREDGEKCDWFNNMSRVNKIKKMMKNMNGTIRARYIDPHFGDSWKYSKDHRRDLICESWNCGDKKKCHSQKIWTCGCGENMDAVPNGDYCCDDYMFVAAQTNIPGTRGYCKAVADFTEWKDIKPPIEPTVQNGCQMKFASDNPAMTLFKTSQQVLKAWDILTSWGENYGGDDRKWVRYKGHNTSTDKVHWKYLSDWSLGKRQKILELFKELSKEYALKQIRIKEELEKDENKASAAYASGQLFLEFLRDNEELILEYENALKDYHHDWFRGGLDPAGHEPSVQSVLGSSEGAVVNDSEHVMQMIQGDKANEYDSICRQANRNGGKGFNNFLCNKYSIYSMFDGKGKIRECDKKNIWKKRKKNKRCFMRRYKIKVKKRMSTLANIALIGLGGPVGAGIVGVSNGKKTWDNRQRHLELPTPVHLNFNPVNKAGAKISAKAKRKERLYHLYDAWVPKGQKWDHYGKNVSKRKRSFKDAEHGQKFFKHHLMATYRYLKEQKLDMTENVLTACTKEERRKNPESCDNKNFFIDFELGIRKDCLENNYDSMGNPKLNPEDMPEECITTDAQLYDLAFLTYSMNWAYSNGKHKKSKKLMYQKEQHRYILLNAIQHAYALSTRYLEVMSEARQKKIECITQMHETNKQRLDGSKLVLKAGKYTDSAAPSVQASSNAQKRNWNLKVYDPYAPGSPKALFAANNGIKDGAKFGNSLLSGAAGLSGVGSGAAVGAIMNRMRKEAMEKDAKLVSMFDEANGPSLRTAASSSGAMARNAALSGASGGSGLAGNSSNNGSSAAGEGAGAVAALSTNEDPNAVDKNNAIDPNMGGAGGSGGFGAGGGDVWGSAGGAGAYGAAGAGGYGADGSGTGAKQLSDQEKDSVLSSIRKSDYAENDDDSLFQLVSKRYVLYGYPKLLNRKEVKTQKVDKKQEKLKKSLMDDLNNF
jgi:hypothetical protein